MDGLYTYFSRQVHAKAVTNSPKTLRDQPAVFQCKGRKQHSTWTTRQAFFAKLNSSTHFKNAPVKCNGQDILEIQDLHFAYSITYAARPNVNQ